MIGTETNGHASKSHKLGQRTNKMRTAGSDKHDDMWFHLHMVWFVRFDETLVQFLFARKKQWLA
jgi:hypothetical protein